MTTPDPVADWNAHADEFNKWSHLGDTERAEWLAFRASHAGDELARAIDAFSADDTRLMAPDDMRNYAGKWVASYSGQIVANDDLHALVAELTAKGFPIGQVAIRFIESDDIVTGHLDARASWHTWLNQPERDEWVAAFRDREWAVPEYPPMIEA